jgi:hypothetical protein
MHGDFLKKNVGYKFLKMPILKQNMYWKYNILLSEKHVKLR